MSVKAFLYATSGRVGEGDAEVRRFPVDESAVTNFEYLQGKVRQYFPQLQRKSFKLYWKGKLRKRTTVSLHALYFRRYIFASLWKGLSVCRSVRQSVRWPVSPSLCPSIICVSFNIVRFCLKKNSYFSFSCFLFSFRRSDCDGDFISFSSDDELVEILTQMTASRADPMQVSSCSFVMSRWWEWYYEYCYKTF